GAQRERHARAAQADPAAGRAARPRAEGGDRHRRPDVRRLRQGARRDPPVTGGGQGRPDRVGTRWGRHPARLRTRYPDAAGPGGGAGPPRTGGPSVPGRAQGHRTGTVRRLPRRRRPRRTRRRHLRDQRRHRMSEYALPWLVADVGGTNARFGLVRRPGGPPEAIAVLRDADHEDLPEAVAAYLADHAGGVRPGAACLAIAGPVSGDRYHLTNAGWTGSVRDLGLPSALLLNDFEALALA